MCKGVERLLGPSIDAACSTRRTEKISGITFWQPTRYPTMPLLTGGKNEVAAAWFARYEAGADFWLARYEAGAD